MLLDLVYCMRDNVRMFFIVIIIFIVVFFVIGILVGFVFMMKGIMERLIVFYYYFK